MQSVIEQLAKRNEFLHAVMDETTENILAAASGKLCIRGQGQKVEYQYRTSDVVDESSGMKVRVLRESAKPADMEIIRSLAQRDYDKKVLKMAQKQSRAIEQFLDAYDEDGLKDIYGGLSGNYRELIHSYEVPDEVYAYLWQKEELDLSLWLGSGPEIYTQRGDRVRTLSEKQIADHLHERRIPYKYLEPLQLGETRMRPCFTILNRVTRQVIYWEHLESLDDPECSEAAVQKMNAYIRAGILPGRDLILTGETLRNPLEDEVIISLINELLGTESVVQNY